MKCDRDAVNNHLVSVFVRVFLEKRETLFLRFCDEFKKLTLADEKQDLVDNFLSKIHVEMDNDPIWQGIIMINQLTILYITLLRIIFVNCCVHI